MDTPFHRFENGMDLSELKLQDLIDLEAIRIEIPYSKTLGIKLSDLEKIDSSLLEGKAVLFNTGWDENWGTEKYYDGNPFLTKEVAEYLRDSKGENPSQITFFFSKIFLLSSKSKTCWN